MAPTSVFDKLTTTTIKMTTTTNNNLSAYIANNSVVNSGFFSERFRTRQCEESTCRFTRPFFRPSALNPFAQQWSQFYLFVTFFLSFSLFLFFLAIWLCLLQSISHFLQVRRHVRRNASLTRSALFFFILIIFRVLSSSTSRINQHWYRI